MRKEIFINESMEETRIAIQEDNLLPIDDNGLGNEM